MSILCGILKQRGAVVKNVELHRLASPTRRYATGDASIHVMHRIGMALQPYFSHERSKLGSRPLVDPYGNLLCFDGRLDNWSELACLLDLRQLEMSDADIVLAAFSEWGTDCFARLTGDWAIALWSKANETLFLARDHAGTRTLYFEQTETDLVWATHLDTFMSRECGKQVSREYALCYLSGLPLRDRTPYVGIASVLPGDVTAIRNGRVSKTAHWTPFRNKTIRYGRLLDYDQRFLEVFGNAITRRTGAGAPVLAQLSGGMDSTAIVCMSDHLRRKADANADILDTLSYYDDSERSLDEKAFFTITERQRAKTGIHIDTAYSQRSFRPHEGEAGSYLVPGADSFTFQFEQRLRKDVWSRGYRSILSGIGGDEVTGGIPDGRPELADYFVAGRLLAFLGRAFAWSLVDRNPLVATLYSATRYSIRPHAGRTAIKPPSWLAQCSFRWIEELRAASIPTDSALSARPSERDNGFSWWSAMETLPHLFPCLLCRPEYRYPFLDKDLVEYLFGIPRDVVLQPGRRRTLMRRALAGIVPGEILERRRKAYQFRAPLKVLNRESLRLMALFQDSRLAEMGLIEPTTLQVEIEQIANGREGAWQAVIRAIALELWLRSIESSEGHNADASGYRDVLIGSTA
ncbi:asparagine synthase-related protein [Silvibacterium sp.]|uniref:asparagine synthase-related protein n=1 Tax=Silvibacterium sp. TaxID=1964179 RepID=UPI0039E6F85A